MKNKGEERVTDADRQKLAVDPAVNDGNDGGTQPCLLLAPASGSRSEATAIAGVCAE